MLPLQLCLAALVWLLVVALANHQHNPRAAHLAPQQTQLLAKLAVMPLVGGLTHEASCTPARPFLCPNSAECIPLDYLCDGTVDCPANFDEEETICKALNRRPPTDQTESLLRLLVAARDQERHKITKLIGARLIKRSGISDQILAEIQMNRALRKQVERAKQAATTGAKSETTTSTT